MKKKSHKKIKRKRGKEGLKKNVKKTGSLKWDECGIKIKRNEERKGNHEKK